MRFLAVSLLFALGQPESQSSLDGLWKLVSVEADEGIEKTIEPRFVWVIKKNQIRYAGQPFAQFSVDKATSPPSIDFVCASPKRTLEGIYSVEKDVLKVCVNRQTDGIKERPGEFSTKGKPEWRLLTFERLPPGENPNEGLGSRVGLVLAVHKDRKGILIADVQKGSPAEKAGVKKGDVLLQVGGNDAVELLAVVTTIRRIAPGTEISLRIERDGKEHAIPVKAGVLPFYFLE